MSVVISTLFMHSSLFSAAFNLWTSVQVSLTSNIEVRNPNFNSPKFIFLSHKDALGFRRTSFRFSSSQGRNQRWEKRRAWVNWNYHDFISFLLARILSYETGYRGWFSPLDQCIEVRFQISPSISCINVIPVNSMVFFLIYTNFLKCCWLKIGLVN